MNRKTSTPTTDASGVASTRQRFVKALRNLVKSELYPPLPDAQQDPELLMWTRRPNLGNIIREKIEGLSETGSARVRFYNGSVDITLDTGENRVHPLRKGAVGKRQMNHLLAWMENPAAHTESWGAFYSRETERKAEEVRRSREEFDAHVAAQKAAQAVMDERIRASGFPPNKVGAYAGTDGKADSVVLHGDWTPERVSLLLQAAKNILEL